MQTQAFPERANPRSTRCSGALHQMTSIEICADADVYQL